MEHTQNRLHHAAFQGVAFALGFTALVVQLLFVRELMNFYVSNELILGAVLAVWMLLTALGAALGKAFVKSRRLMKFFPFLFLIYNLLPLLLFFLLRIFRNAFFPPGILVSFNDVMLISAVFLALLCLLSGFAFTSLANIYSFNARKNTTSRIYYWETAGSVVGGLLFTFVLVQNFNAFQILRLVALFSLCLLIVWGFQFRNKVLIAFSSIIAIIIIVSFTLDIDGYTKKLFFRNQILTADADTPHGQMAITLTYGQWNIYESGSLIYSSGDVALAEEKVHYAMWLHPEPKSTLLIGGGASGTLNELLKYKDVDIAYADYNEYIVQLARRTGLMPDTSIKVYYGDPVRTLKKDTRKYDVIILDLPEPVNLFYNRFYTSAFFKSIAAHLGANGIFMLSMQNPGAYMNQNVLIMQSMIFNTLHTAFNQVRVIPGIRHYFVSSQNKLTLAYENAWRNRKIKTVYVNPFYISDELLNLRSNQIENMMLSSGGINTDEDPRACFYQNRYWLNMSQGQMYPVYAILIILIVLMGLKFNPITFTQYAGGFAATGLEIIFLLYFQMIFGYMYAAMGLLIALFMAGLALGAAIEPFIVKKAGPRILLYIHSAIALAAFISPIFLVSYSAGVSSLFLMVLLLFFVLLVASLIGLSFAVSTRVYPKSNAVAASDLYSADMAGGALAAILFTVFLIPFLGLMYSPFFITFVNVLCALVLWKYRYKYI